MPLPDDVYLTIHDAVMGEEEESADGEECKQ